MNTGLELFKRMQRLQGGTEAVPEELPTPPEGQELGYGGKAIAWVADQVRQGVLPDEALAEIKRDPASLRSMMAYANAALTAGTLLSGARGGERLPSGVEPIRAGVEKPVIPDVEVVNTREVGSNFNNWETTKDPLVRVDPRDGSLWRWKGRTKGSRGGSINTLERVENSPEGHQRGKTSVGVVRGYPPTHMLNTI